MNLKDEMAQLLRLVLVRRLEEADGNVTDAARIAGIGRQHFYGLARQAGLNVTAARKRGTNVMPITWRTRRGPHHKGLRGVQ
jgi:hypothetical protein